MANNNLYRHFDETGQLLYVGVSIGAVSRLEQHHLTAHWSSQIRKVTIEPCAGRADALQKEGMAIITENPLYNKNHTGLPKCKKSNYQLFLEKSAAFRAEVKHMYADGMKQTDIAKKLRVSRARINQILRPAKAREPITAPLAAAPPPRRIEQSSDILADAAKQKSVPRYPPDAPDA